MPESHLFHPVSKSQLDHPLNQRASELLKDAKLQPSPGLLLPLVQLVVEVLENRFLYEEPRAALYRLSPEIVMKQLSPRLEVSDLEDHDPEEAAYKIVEALGFEDFVAYPT